MLWSSTPSVREEVPAVPYRLEHITTEDRVRLGCAMVARAGEYGLVTRLAREYGVSRQTLYGLRDRTRVAAEAELSPRPPGPKPVDERLRVDELAVSRAILVLNQAAHASVRVIGECVEEILGVRRSIGSICGVLKGAASRARALPQPVPGHPVKVAADEVYAAGEPVLEVVEHESGLILLLEPAGSIDETTWGCALLDLEGRGVEIERVVADGGKGLRAGVRAAGGTEPDPDHWHVLRDLGRVESYLEGEAYRRLGEAQKLTEEARVREHQRIHGGRRCRMGRSFGVGATDPESVGAAIAAAEEAVARHDGVEYLLGVVRDVLAPVDARTGRVRDASRVRGELVAAAALLRELGGRAIGAAKLLEKRASGLVAYLMPLQRELAPVLRELGEETVRYLALAWRHKRALGLVDGAQAWTASPEQARRVWAILEGAVRASGMVENLGSLLAPHRASHKGLREDLLRVFAVYRNHRTFERGERAGYSPLQLAGLPSPHWLDALGYGRPTPAANPTRRTEDNRTVNTIAA